MRIYNYARVQDFARGQDPPNGLSDEMSQARHSHAVRALRKDSLKAPACAHGKNGETLTGEAKEVLPMRPQNHDIPQWKLVLFALILLLGVAQIVLIFYMQGH